MMNQRKESFLWNLLCNIILPVLILNKAHSFFPSNGEQYSLILALAFPFGYGLREYIAAKTINTLSAIGLVSVLLTGGLALMKLEGIFFAIKEALIPLIIALFILCSVFFYKKPLLYIVLIKSPLFKSQLILDRVKTGGKESQFNRLMKTGTLWLSGSFLLSAILNFVIAFFVFTDIDIKLSPEKRSQILNEQIADMTWMGYIMIALPLSILMIALIWYLTKQLKKITDLTLEEIINPQK